MQRGLRRGWKAVLQGHGPGRNTGCGAALLRQEMQKGQSVSPLPTKSVCNAHFLNIKFRRTCT